MGDTRRFKKHFAKPFKPWDEIRIAEEKPLIKDYGLKNKKEIWAAEAMLRTFKAQAKKLIATRGKQAEKEKQQLLARLLSLGLTNQAADLDTVLGLTIKNILDRRLQTLVHNKKLARSIGQARQFIVHEHILVNGKKIAVPSYLVRKNEEEAIAFADESALASLTHPERMQKQAATPTDTESTESVAETKVTEA
ncbi:MAG TPA: 30S ribosomal protein S4 [Candidatus Nanoarchaeia archaeon]|nr:30S ribosomal protein S4 [Candidatus Nanoarchaeia archaeon]